MLQSILQAKLGQTRTGAPMVTIDGMPGSIDAEMTPAQLRALAATLGRIAAAAEARGRVKGKRLAEQRLAFPIEQNPA